MGIDSVRKYKPTIKTALWVSENAHSVREVGLIFFALALFTGVIWMSGKDVEPIVYVLGSIGTLLFTSPSIARFVQAGRKPVRHMSYDEILSFINQTNARTEWKAIKTNWAEEAFLKEDPRLRIRVRWDDSGVHDKEINLPWTTAHAERKAISYWYDLSYDGALIDRFILVTIEGKKVILPLPDSTTLEVDPLTYKVAQIFDDHNTLDGYMSKAGFKLKKAYTETGCE